MKFLMTKHNLYKKEFLYENNNRVWEEDYFKKDWFMRWTKITLWRTFEINEINNLRTRKNYKDGE